jgi:hypothetical protein
VLDWGLYRCMSCSQVVDQSVYETVRGGVAVSKLTWTPSVGRGSVQEMPHMIVSDMVCRYTYSTMYVAKWRKER